MLCILAVRFSPRDTVETTDGAIDVVRARERPVLVEDAPGTHELGLAWGSSAGGMSCAPDVTPAPLGTGAAHLVIERVEVLGAIHRRAVSKRTAFSRAFLAAHSSSKAIVHLAGPLGAPGSGTRFRCHSVPSALYQPPFCSSHVQPCGLGPRGRGLGPAFARRRSRRTSGLSPIQGRRRQVPQIPLVVGGGGFSGRITSGWLPLFGGSY